MPRDVRMDRRGVGLSVVALWLSGCAGNVATVFSLAPPPAGPDEAEVALGLDPVRRITAAVRINGQGPFEFVVDTGANRTVISEAVARRLGLPSAGTSNVHGVAGVEPAPLVLVERLEVDAVASRGLRTPILARERLGADGLLGVDVLRDRRVLMDFVRNRLTIGPERASTPERSSFDVRRDSTGATAFDLGKRIAVPARYRFGQLIIVGADVAGRPVTAFIDSGSQSTVGNGALQRLASGSAALPRPAQLRSPILSATGQTSEGVIGSLPALRIGGLTITGLTTVFADLHVFDIWDLTKRPSLLIGMDVIRQFNAVELNYTRREVAFYLRRTDR